MSDHNDTAIIMCAYKRVHRLQHTIDMLRSQTVRDFDFHIWNNNPDAKAEVDQIVTENLDVVTTARHSDNVGPMGRFIRAKEIADQVKHIIFFDDDQDFQPELVHNMIECYEENTITAWWAWHIPDGNAYVRRARIRDSSTQPEWPINYCGTGGMIIDPVIFKTLDLADLPDEYSFIEDLWLSYVAKYEYGYKLVARQFPIWIQCKDEHALWKKISMKGKDNFLQILRAKYESGK